MTLPIQNNKKLWALKLIDSFLKDTNLNSTRESLAIEASDDLEHSKTLVLTNETQNSLIAILEEYERLSLSNSFDRVALDRKIDEEIRADGSNISPPTKKVHKFDVIHGGKPILFAQLFKISNDDTSVLITSSTDKSLRVTNPTTDSCIGIHYPHDNSNILDICQHPQLLHVFVTGGMDGCHHLINILTGDIFQSFKDHKKYIVKVCFDSTGTWFATASYDTTVNLYKLESNTDNVEYRLYKTLYFKAAVESLCLLTQQTIGLEDTFVIGTREDNYLHYISVPSLEHTSFNMNQNGDDWVSFTPMYISPSPSLKHLLVYTDSQSGKVHLQRTWANAKDTSTLSSNSSNAVIGYFGMDSDAFSRPRLAWHESGRYFYATSDCGAVYLFSVWNGEKVKLSGHSGIVRSLAVGSDTNGQQVLVSGGFDGSVIVWGC